ncbi:MAG: DUF2393 domain-containing protein [Acidobacteriia bacterium]|nr:DUF2393 domain-containing protein [Terriglobia bacterium]
MGGLIQPSPATTERESNWRPVMLGIALVVVVVGVIAFFLRSQSKPAIPPHPYAANLKLSDLKMSAAENFVGASVTYVEGTVSNTGDKTVTHAVVRVIFKDDIGQVVGDDSVALRALQPSGPYPDAVDLNTAPLAPGQSKPFRLTFESISAQWNHEYPDVQVTDVTVK